MRASIELSAATFPYGGGELTARDGGRASFALGALAVLLVYLVLAGPLNFGRARRKGRPAAALVRLAWLTAVAFALVCALGAGARSCTHRVRLDQLSANGPSSIDGAYG